MRERGGKRLRQGPATRFITQDGGLATSIKGMGCRETTCDSDDTKAVVMEISMINLSRPTQRLLVATAWIMSIPRLSRSRVLVCRVIMQRSPHPRDPSPTFVGSSITIKDTKAYYTSYCVLYYMKYELGRFLCV